MNNVNTDKNKIFNYIKQQNYNNAKTKVRLIKLISIFSCFLVFLIFGSTNVYADTAATDWTTLGETDGIDLSYIEFNCSLTIDEQNNYIHECKFRSTDQTKGASFVFCNMVDMHSNSIPDDPIVTGLTKVHYDVEDHTLVNGTKIIKCVKQPGEGSGNDSSIHYGCKLVTVPVGGETKITFPSSKYIKPDNFTGKVSAFDFQVNYADIISLNGRLFDEKSCDPVLGQGNWLVPQAADSAIWFITDEPFDDPFITTQFSNHLERDISYATFSDFPCLPYDFPLTILEYPTCPIYHGDPPPTTVDLNLFYWESELASLGTLFPTFFTIVPNGDMDGIRIETTPLHDEVFDILGHEMTFGSLTLCSDLDGMYCIPPSIEEGREVTPRIDFFNAETGNYTFAETTRFIKDTQPPEIQDITVLVNEDYTIDFHVSALDLTTSPIYSALWYNAGNGWISITLTPEGDIKDRISERIFEGSIGPFNPGSLIEYFVTVQDVVSNVVFHEPNSVVAVPISQKLDLVFLIDATGSMWDDIAEVQTSATDLIDTIQNQTTVYTRFALATYKDFPIHPYGNPSDYTYKAEHTFTTDGDSMKAAINAITVGGGADLDESVYSAMIDTINTIGLGSWNADDRTIIIMGDAPPHDPEPFTGYTMSSVIDAANAGNMTAPLLPARIMSYNAYEKDSTPLFTTTLSKDEMYKSINANDFTEYSLTELGKDTFYPATSSDSKTTHNSVVPSSIPINTYSIVIGNNADAIFSFTQLATDTGGSTFIAEDADDVVPAIIEALDEIFENIGNDEAPIITLLVADDPDDLNDIYSIFDTITITFDSDTNTPGGTDVQRKPTIDDMFTFSESLGRAYSGKWIAPDTFIITIHSVNNASPPIISGTTVTPAGITPILSDQETSVPSSSISPVLSGDFGITS